MGSGDDQSGLRPWSGGEGRSATEAFELLGHETRLDILRTLASERRLNWQVSGLGFAELRKAVGVDDAGNFSYHLDKLRDGFVTKHGDEYVLTYAGMEIVGSVLAGTYTERPESRSVPTEIPCPSCGAATTATYEHPMLLLKCPDHGVAFGTSIPPGAVRGRDLEVLVRVATMDARLNTERVRSNVCPHCWGPVSTTLPSDEKPCLRENAGGVTAAEPDETWAEFSCDRCGVRLWLPAGACLVTEPVVVAFFDERGIDLRERSYLELPFVASDTPVVESRDPVRIRVDIEHDGDCLSVWLDGDAGIIETELGD